MLAAIAALLMATWLAVTWPARALALPLGWGYELVSPPETSGFDITAAFSSVDGDHAWISALLPLEVNQATGNSSSYIATRSATGWHTRSLANPATPGALSAGAAFDAPDSSATIVLICDFRALVCQGPESFERVASDGTRTLMLQYTPSVPLGAQDPNIVGSSPDASRIIAQTGAGEPPLLAGDTHTRGRGLYASQLGTLEYLGIDEHGAVLDCGAVLANNAPAGSIGQGFEQDGLSSDARTAVFASPDPIEVDAGNCPGPVDLYARRGSKTVNVSAPRNGNPDEGATYVGNTRDGNTIFFVTASQLVAGDTDNFSDIYAYDITTDTLTRLTSGADVFTGFGRPSVQVSADGAYIYFVSNNAIDGQGADTAQNFFVYHDGAINLITSTSEGFIGLGQPVRSQFSSPLTPDGHNLVFYSNAPLTHQPTDGSFQLFQYSTTTGSIRCVSCRSDGTAPSTTPLFGDGQVNTRFQSDDGSSVVFQTTDSYLPQDVNGMQDVYLWRDGTLSLITSGHSPQSSILSGMSADGGTVFFTTYERLTSETTQRTLKLYAARRGGGFPRPNPSPACAEDQCQGLPSLAPTMPPIASTAFRGHGNQRATPRTRLSIARISAAQRRRMARTGMLQLRIRTSRRGRIRVHLIALIAGRWTTVAHRTTHNRDAGATHIGLRLAKTARSYLQRHRSLRIRLVVQAQGATQTASLRLEGTNRGGQR